MAKHRKHKNHEKGRALLLSVFFITAVAAVFIFKIQPGETGLLKEYSVESENKTVAEIRLPVRQPDLKEEHMENPWESHQSKSLRRTHQQENSQIILSMGQRPDTLFISWKGNGKSPQFLRFSREKEDLPQAEPLQAKVAKTLKGQYFRYTVKLKNLKQGKKYWYETGDGITFEGAKSFKAPSDRGRTEFLYLGDVQYESSLKDYDRWGRMVGRIYRENANLDFAVIGGDMINVPTEKEQWNSFINNCHVFSGLPLMTVSGNHEGVHSNITYQKIFAVPQNGPENLKEEFYYFDYGHCRFVMMDSSFLTEARKKKIGHARWQIYEKTLEKWLEKTLVKSNKIWNIAVIHHPPYGMHDRHTVSPQIRELWLPIMEEGEVDMVLSGHQHMYMRTGRINGILYIMGNSGTKTTQYYNGYNAPLYSRAIYSDGPNYQIIKATHSRLQLVSYNEKGLVIDETSLKKGLNFHIIKFFGGS